MPYSDLKKTVADWQFFIQFYSSRETRPSLGQQQTRHQFNEVR